MEPDELEVEIEMELMELEQGDSSDCVWLGTFRVWSASLPK